MEGLVDVRFRLQGNLIPADHGYPLFSAVSQLIPELHSDEELGVHPIAGRPSGNRCITLAEGSSLCIRLPANRIKQVLPLAGTVLSIGEYTVRVGTPQTIALKPAARLYSRIVVIKGFLEPLAFLEAARRQLEKLDIKGKASLVPQPNIAESNAGKHTGTRSPFLRRTIRIRGKEVVGFALRVDGLTAEESILLQEKGLGGRRRFGCGVFIPDKR